MGKCNSEYKNCVDEDTTYNDGKCLFHSSDKNKVLSHNEWVNMNSSYLKRMAVGIPL